MPTEPRRPLAGRTVIVTRPAIQAEALAQPLGNLGAEVAIISALEILPPLDSAPLKAAIAHLETYDWLVVTSANGAAALDHELRAQEKEIAATPRIAAVGMATAQALNEVRAAVRLVPEEHNAEQLARRMAPLVDGKRVLLLQGTSASNTFAERLFAAGARVERVDAYRIAEPPALQKEISLFFHSGKRADAVTFTSAQAAVTFFRALESAGAALPRGTVIASIGPVTSSALRELGRPPDVQAPSATMQSLAQALADYFADRA